MSTIKRHLFAKKNFTIFLCFIYSTTGLRQKYLLFFFLNFQLFSLKKGYIKNENKKILNWEIP